MYSYGSPHTAAQKQDDQHERTFSSYVRIQVVVLKTYLGRWTIGRSGERGSGISVLPARYDDDDECPTSDGAMWAWWGKQFHGPKCRSGHVCWVMAWTRQQGLVPYIGFICSVRLRTASAQTYGFPTLCVTLGISSWKGYKKDQLRTT